MSFSAVFQVYYNRTLTDSDWQYNNQITTTTESIIIKLLQQCIIVVSNVCTCILQTSQITLPGYVAELTYRIAICCLGSSHFPQPITEPFDRRQTKLTHSFCGVLQKQARIFNGVQSTPNKALYKIQPKLHIFYYSISRVVCYVTRTDTWT